jgi:hypothetical protein
MRMPLAGLMVWFLVSLALGACGSTSRPAVYLPADCSSRSVAPVMFLLTACATGQVGVYDITWKSWGAPRSAGHGLAYVNNCRLVCTAGDIHRSSAEIDASMPRRCPNGHLQYTRVTIAVEDSNIALVLAGSYAVPCTTGRLAELGATRSDPGP